jgi:hypothetical protein
MSALPCSRQLRTPGGLLSRSQLQRIDLATFAGFGRGHAQTTAPSTRKKTASSHCLNLQGCSEGAGIVAPRPNRVIRPPRFLQSSGRIAAVRFERGSIAALVLFQGGRVSASLSFQFEGCLRFLALKGLIKVSLTEPAEKRAENERLPPRFRRSH